MSVAAISRNSLVHLGPGENDYLNIGTNLIDVAPDSSKPFTNDVRRRHSTNTAQFLSHLDPRLQNGIVSSRANSLKDQRRSSTLIKLLLLRKAKSDGYLSLSYKDDINKFDSKENDDIASSEEPFEQGIKLFSSLKANVEADLKKSEQLDISKILPQLMTLLKYGGGKVKFETTVFVTDLLPHLGLDVEPFFSKLLPIVVGHLANSKDSISKVSTALLKEFAEITNDKLAFVENFISLGLVSNNEAVKKSSIHVFPHLFNEQFAHLELFNLFQLLVQNLKEFEKESTEYEDTLNALKHIRYIKGPKEFGKYESMLIPKIGNILSGTIFAEDGNDGDDEDSANDEEEEEEEKENEEVDIILTLGTPEEREYKSSTDEDDRLIDVIPEEVLDKMDYEDNPLLRREGCEELLSFIEWTESLEGIVGHISPLLTLLNTFKEDADFGVATISLRVISVLLMKAPAEELYECLFPFVLSTTFIFSDDRFVVRSEANKVFESLLQKFSTRRISRNLVVLLKHRNSRVREAAINLLTSALLTFPRDSFDLGFLCREIVPTLADSRRRVRQAALENVATLAQGLGDKKYDVLMTEVADLEETKVGYGVTAAVRCRLARRALPRLTSDGFIEYWLPVVSVAKKNSGGVPLGSDIEWVLSGRGTLSVGSVCEPTPALFNGSCQSLDTHFGEPRTRQDISLSSSFPHQLLLSKLRRENVQSSLHGRRRSISATSINKGERSLEPPLEPSVTPSPSPEGGYILLGSSGARTPLLPNNRSLSFPGLPLVPRKASAAAHFRPVVTSLEGSFLGPTPTAPVALPLSAPPVRPTHALTPTSEEPTGMWKVMGPAPHWEGHQKKMWSPIPVGRRDPVKLPFLEVTPSTVLERLRGHSEKNSSEDDRSPLALWSTEPIDLSRTAPHEFGGYRSVYLGKLRKSSALGRPINPDKSYALLPNKFASGGIGSARGTERGGLSSPQISSPAHNRKPNALQPIDQVDSLGASLNHQSLSKMPPLRSGRARSSERSLKEENEMFSEEEEEEFVQEVLEKQEGHFEEAEASDNMVTKWERYSAETRDSGISIQSPNAEENVLDDWRASPSSEKKRGEKDALEDNSVVPFHAEVDTEDGNYPSGKETSTEEERSPNEERPRGLRILDLPPPSAPAGRNSYDPMKGGIHGSRGKFRKDSTHSLPPSIEARQAPIIAKGKAFATLPSRNKGSYLKSRSIPKPANNDNLRFKSFDYESEFESEEEDKKGMAPSSITRMRNLKKKRNSIREMDKRLIERDPEKAKDYRLRKYKELEERHSGNSLQITKPSNIDRLTGDPLSRGRFNKNSPRPSPRAGPNTRRQPFDLPLPKSRSHDQNLSKVTSPTYDGRPASLDRLEGGVVKPTFSRAPTQQKKVVRTTGRAAPVSMTPPSRRSTPGKVLDSISRTPTLSEKNIPTARYQSSRNLSAVRGDNFRPYKNPREIYSETLDLLKNDEWEEQVEGIQSIARLATFHPEVILPNLKEIRVLLMKHAKSLRSQVCRTGIQAFTQLFLSLKKQLEPDLEKLVALLLHRTSDTNKFLKEDSNCALDAMVEVMTPVKAIAALISVGIGHRNPQVRTTLGRLLAYSVERMGASQAINQRDVAEKVFPATATLAQAGSLETRQMAKLTFQRLSTDNQFETALKKYVPSEEIRQIQRFLENMYNEQSRGVDVARKAANKGGSRFARTM